MKKVFSLILMASVAAAAFGMSVGEIEPVEPALPTIPEIAIEDGRFTTLVAALQAADLVETLSGPGPFTVFAPTDDAFAKLPAGTVEALLGDIPALTEILTYHVVPGRLMAGDVVGVNSVDTVQGSMIDVAVDGGRVVLDGSAVVQSVDILGTNGVIHVIDTVIVPN